MEVATKKVPELRFPDFEGELSMHKLDELGYFKGGGTPTTKKANFWNGDIPWISSSDIKEDDIFNISKKNFITKEALISSATKLIPKNAVLIISRVGIGKFAVSNENLCTSQDFTNLICKNDYSAIYVAYLFLSNKNKFKRFSQGTSIKGFTTKDIKKAKLFFPQISEQQKIADFLSQVDKKIDLLSQKEAALREYKKGVMQKLFSQEIRFKIINDAGELVEPPDWEEVKLDKLLSIPDKAKPSSIDIDKIITVKLHLKGIKINERTESLKLGSTNYYKRSKGQFIYGKQNLFNGAFGIVPEKYDGYVSSGDVPALNINGSNVNSKYLFYYFSRYSFYKRLENIASGSGSKRIHEKTLLTTFLVGSMIK
jgi:type I restriction enzyme S subunit